MGANTKYGRTRNRRALALNAPPAGWPNMLVLTALTHPSANVVTFGMRSANGQYYAPASFAGSGEIHLWSDPDGEMQTATAVWDGGIDVLTVTKADGWIADELYVIQPWNANLRGLNGEWLAPLAFNCPTS
jgi:hypothetical protein